MILFDEPTSALDPIISLTILDLIKETQLNLKKTYIVISHDILGMFRIADKVAMLYDGRITSVQNNITVNLFPDSHKLTHSSLYSSPVIPAKAGSQEDLSYNRKHTHTEYHAVCRGDSWISFVRWFLIHDLS
jgi:ABC-type dipeptide/oligopeptide/nickel transport system ATPase component